MSVEFITNQMLLKFVIITLHKNLLLQLNYVKYTLIYPIYTYVRYIRSVESMSCDNCDW